MSDYSANIRIYKLSDDGNLFDTREEWDLRDFCNTVPNVGDLIVTDWLVRGDLDARDPTNRRIYEVCGRYFMPGRRSENWAYVAVVVNERTVKSAELELL